MKVSLFIMFHKFGEYIPGNWVCGNDWEGKGWYSMVLDGKLVKKKNDRWPLKQVEAGEAGGGTKLHLKHSTYICLKKCANCF